MINIVYLCRTLKNCGPTRQSLYISKNINKQKFNYTVYVMRNDMADSMISDFNKHFINVKVLNFTSFNFFKNFNIIKNEINLNKVDLIHSLGIIPNLYSYFLSLVTDVKTIITQRSVYKEILEKKHFTN